MSKVFDSGSDFEKLTSEWYPDTFNSSNSKTEIDSRSGKKGPEPEDIQVIKDNGKVFAVIGLERIGGIMVYDITEPSKAVFYDYINLRDFSGTDVSNSGSLAPEGLCMIETTHSPTGKALMLVANEVSGNVDLIQFGSFQSNNVSNTNSSVNIRNVSNNSNNAQTVNSDISSPKTGENTPLILLFSLTAISLLVAFMTRVCIHK
jgi:hypothetical protein